ncbi:hypothetical protein E2C01_022357 [Portunus trituberculatus]|uniref:Uncharacterized protein n=1 Tax=Portunus trituberculatus TaxID=210409 RepID=A0A5B7E727_PORTR|nr:hypothetical protein [Portunus trituberculatus]
MKRLTGELLYNTAICPKILLSSVARHLPAFLSNTNTQSNSQFTCDLEEGVLQISSANICVSVALLEVRDVFYIMSKPYWAYLSPL